LVSLVLYTAYVFLLLQNELGWLLRVLFILPTFLFAVKAVADIFLTDTKLVLQILIALIGTVLIVFFLSSTFVELILLLIGGAIWVGMLVALLWSFLDVCLHSYGYGGRAQKREIKRRSILDEYRKEEKGS